MATVKWASGSRCETGIISHLTHYAACARTFLRESVRFVQYEYATFHYYSILAFCPRLRTCGYWILLLETEKQTKNLPKLSFM